MMLRFLTLLAVTVALLTPANARGHHHRHIATQQTQPTLFQWPFSGLKLAADAVYEGASRVIGGRPSGCPSAFCGCSTSLKIFGRIIPELNRAAAWAKFPPATPGPGMVAYKQHHVFAILAVHGDGTVLAYDGNSGHHLTRIHTVSLRGYRVVNPRG